MILQLMQSYQKEKQKKIIQAGKFLVKIMRPLTKVLLF